MISTKNTTAQKLSSSKYLSFNEWLNYSIDTQSMTIEPVSFKKSDDIYTFWTEMSINWQEYSVKHVHNISFESEYFKRVIEKVHNVDHYSHNISIYQNKFNKAFAIRIAIDEDIFLIELM